MSNIKTVIVGLDGGCWEFIRPWVEAGDLPAIRYLQENGVWSTSLSEFPPVTSPSWKCYSTGRNPGKLGVFWWEILDVCSRQIVMPQSTSYSSEEIFDYLGRSGLRVGVINMPTTFPPKPVEGFMISGGPDCAESGYTYPRELEQQLVGEFGYRIHPRFPIKHHLDVTRDLEAQVRDILELIDLRFQVAYDFLDDVDVLQVTIFYINVLQHFLYRQEPVLRGWQLIDQHLARLMEMRHRIILLSDHGSHSIDTVFNVNAWLEQEGYLRTRSRLDTARRLHRLGIHKDRLVKVADILGLRRILVRLVPGSLKSSLLSYSGTATKRDMALNIDWDTTVALGSGEGPLYINYEVEGEQYEALRDELIEKLEALTSPINGERMFLKVYRREEVYSGPYLERAPDLVLDLRPGVFINAGIGKEKVFEPPEQWEADNIRDGIFLAYGPEFSLRKLPDKTSILDIVPTILHLYGLPIPKDMDGRVLLEVFEQGSEPAKRAIRFVEESSPSEVDEVGEVSNEDDQQAIVERLTALGYLD